MERIRPVVKSRPWRTSGSQKWEGARPTFRARASIMAVAVTGWESCVIDQEPVSHAFERQVKRSTAAAAA